MMCHLFGRHWDWQCYQSTPLTRIWQKGKMETPGQEEEGKKVNSVLWLPRSDSKLLAVPSYAKRNSKMFIEMEKKLSFSHFNLVDNVPLF